MTVAEQKKFEKLKADNVQLKLKLKEAVELQKELSHLESKAEKKEEVIATLRNDKETLKAERDSLKERLQDYIKDKASPAFRLDYKKFLSLPNIAKYAAGAIVLFFILNWFVFQPCNKRKVKSNNAHVEKQTEIDREKQKVIDSMNVHLEETNRQKDTLMIMVADIVSARIKIDNEGEAKREKIKIQTDDIKKRIANPNADRDAIWADIMRTREGAKVRTN